MVSFSQDQNQFCLSSQTFACLQHSFLRTVENVNIHNFVIPNGAWENVLYIILTLIMAITSAIQTKEE